MAGPDPATQRASVREPNKPQYESSRRIVEDNVIRRADARRLGGRLGGWPWRGLVIQFNLKLF
jgi:hypothetical protein